MKNKIYSSIIVLMLVALLLSGCMVGPKYEKPKTIADSAQWSFERRFYDSNDANGIGRWWENFADETTEKLVLEALDNNYDIIAAAAKVLQAEAEYKMAGGKLWPQVDIGYDGKVVRQNSGPPGSATAGAGEVTKTRTHNPDMTISYVLDLFGKLKHGRAAELKDLMQTRANQKAVVNSLIASVVTSRINIATFQKRLAIARANTQSRKNTLEIVERRYRQGLVGPVDVRLARENYPAAKAAEPDMELSLATAQNALDVLLARAIGSSKHLSETLPELPSLGPVPIGLPGSLLRQRPDVLEAEMRLQGQNQRIGVSIANMYPDFNFTLGMGWQSNTSGMIFVDQAWFYSALLSMAQPVFAGGQLAAKVDWEEARFKEFAADYAKVVLTAMREVEDEMVTQQMLAKKLQYVQIQFAEASAAEKLARDRYNRGVETILSVLETERRRHNAEDSLAVLKGQIWTGRVNLFLALGGDWVSE